MQMLVFFFYIFSPLVRSAGREYYWRFCVYQRAEAESLPALIFFWSLQCRNEA